MENRVGFWPRVAASLIDVVIMAVLAVLLKGVAASLLGDAIERKVAEALAKPGAEAAKGMLTSMITWSMAFAAVAPFYGLIEGLLGYSPGKLAIGLRIVSESGQPAPRATLLLRYLVKASAGLLGLVAFKMALPTVELVSQIASGVLFVGCFLVITKARQALHDKIVGTAVLRKSDVGALAAVPA